MGGGVTTNTNAVAAEELTTLRAAVLSGYYGLLAEGRQTEWIGGHEIVAWIQEHLPHMDVPSESTATKTLLAAGLDHRGRGQPSLESRAVHPVPPFVLVRTTPPHSRSRSRGP